MTEATKGRVREGASARVATGTAEWVGRGKRGCWFAKISIPGHPRERVKLFDPEDGNRPLDNRERDRDRARVLAGEVSKVLRAEAAQREAVAHAKRLTVEQFGTLWTSGELLEQYGDVNRLKVKASAKVDEYRLKAYVYPRLGSKRVDEVTEQDIEETIAWAARQAEKKRGKPWRKGTRFQLYQVLHRMFDLAIRPGRLREDNPVTRYMRPGKDHEKLFGFLYPTELVKVLECANVPIARRVLYAMAVYTGLRKGSLLALEWRNLDFHHRTLTVLKTKTGLPQMFEIPASLSNLLAAYYKHLGEPKKHRKIIAPGAIEIREERTASTLREDLEAAGLEREILLPPKEGAKPGNVELIRFHDLRATFVTWAMREGRGDGWISDRTGHLTPAMRARYARAARLLADLQYQPFPDISDTLPELHVSDNVARLSDYKGQG